MSVAIMTRGVEFPMGWRFKLDSVTPKLLTGYKVLIQIRAHEKSDVVLSEWTEESSVVVFTPLSGAVDILLPPSLTISYTFKTAVIDCWVYNGAIDTDGDRSPLYTITLNWGSSRP